MKKLVEHSITVLQQRCKTAKPVKVRVGPVPGDDLGQTDWMEDHFLIRINSKSSTQLQIHMLVHEWAHCMCWSICEDTKHDDHGPHFGISYAEAYRAVFDGV